MSSDWIGIADDLTEHGVIGRSYADPATQSAVNSSPVSYPLSGHGVIDRPYTNLATQTSVDSSSVSYPSPPKYGWLTIFAAIFWILLIGSQTSMGKKIIHAMDNKAGVSNTGSAYQLSSATETDSKPAIANNRSEKENSQSRHKASPAKRQAGESGSKKKHEKRKPDSDGNQSSPPTETPPNSFSNDKGPSPAESEVDLQKYRNISGRL